MISLYRPFRKLWAWGLRKVLGQFRVLMPALVVGVQLVVGVKFRCLGLRAQGLGCIGFSGYCFRNFSVYLESSL